MAAHLTRVKGEDKKNDDSNELENELKDPKVDSGEIYKEKAKTEDIPHEQNKDTGTRPKTITIGSAGLVSENERRGKQQHFKKNKVNAFFRSDKLRQSKSESELHRHFTNKIQPIAKKREGSCGALNDNNNDDGDVYEHKADADNEAEVNPEGLSPNDSASQFHIHSPRHLIISGQGSENSISIAPPGCTEVFSKIGGQTKLLLKEVQNETNKNVYGVRTNLFTKAMKKLHTPGQKQILIMKGEGLGCDYVAKMIFAIESSKNSNEGLYLNDVSDWAFANSQIADTAAVVLILNANLSEWNTILEHQMFPSANRGGSLLVIMTTNENDVNATLEPFVLDASRHDALPTKLEKAHVFDMMAKRKVLTVITGDLDKTKKATKNDPRPTITTRTRESILQALGTHMWVRRLKTFFVGDMEEGSLFFRKPDPKLVEEFKKLFANDRICSKALGLIVTYMFGRYDRNIAKRLQNTHAIKVYQSDIRDAKHARTKLPYPRFKHIENYCDRCLKQVEFNVDDGLKQLQEAMLIDESNQFAGEHIRISLMVALNEVIPQGIIESCDEDFFFNFVKCEKTGGKPEHAFIRTEQGFKAFFKRIMYHWEHDMKRCIGHQVLFRNFEGFLKYLKHKKHMRWNILSKLDNNYCVLYYGMERGDQCKTLTEIILNEGTWKKKRKQKHLLQMAKEQEEKALFHAAELKNTSAFKFLVQNGVPITENAFIAALKEKAVGIIEFCLNGAEFDDNVWTNCLHECLRVNNHRILQKCMEAKQSLLNQSCTDIMPLIHRVLSDKMMLEVLLEGSWSKHVNVNIIYQSEGDKGTTALILATEDGNIDAVEYLLQKGAKQRQTDVDYSPICIAAKNGHLNIVKALVNNDTTILDDPGCGQERLITIASRCGFHDIVNFIKESKSSA